MPGGGEVEEYLMLPYTPNIATGSLFPFPEELLRAPDPEPPTQVK